MHLGHPDPTGPLDNTRAPAIAEKPRDSFMSVEMLADVAYG